MKWWMQKKQINYNVVEEKKNSKILELKIKRNSLLNETDWIIQRHQEQTELKINRSIFNTSITDEKCLEWLEYRQLLRDLPNRDDFDLKNPQWPIVPS